MVYYTVRIDTKGDSTLDRLKTFLDHERYIKYLVYKETSDVTKKVHYQGFVEIADDHHAWHKTRWSKAFPDYTKGQKSSALVNKDSYLVYVTKDKDLVLSKGCTEEFINTLQTQSYHKDCKKNNDTYTKFLNFCLNSEEIDHKKYNINYIRRLLFRYLGSSDDVEVKRIEYYRSLCFKIQAKLLYGSIQDTDEYKSAEDRFITAIS